jgi:hypothetical protein
VHHALASELDRVGVEICFDFGYDFCEERKFHCRDLDIEDVNSPSEVFDVETALSIRDLKVRRNQDLFWWIVSDP